MAALLPESEVLTRPNLVSGHYGGVAKQKVSTDYSQPHGTVHTYYWPLPGNVWIDTIKSLDNRFPTA